MGVPHQDGFVDHFSTLLENFYLTLPSQKAIDCSATKKPSRHRLEAVNRNSRKFKRNSLNENFATSLQSIVYFWTILSLAYLTLES